MRSQWDTMQLLEWPTEKWLVCGTTRILYALLVGLQNGTLENSLAVS